MTRPVKKSTLLVEDLPIGRIVPYARNPRKNEAAVAKTAASIREFGWRQPIVVDTDLTVIAGHTRLLAARQLGLATVPVHVATGLTAAQVRAYRLADNRTGEEAEWDKPLLAEELADLRSLDYALGLTGFDDDELADLIAGSDGGSPGDGSPQLGETIYSVVVECDGERQQAELITRLEGEGFTCRLLMS